VAARQRALRHPHGHGKPSETSRKLGFNLQRIAPGEDNSIMVCLSREPLPAGGVARTSFPTQPRKRIPVSGWGPQQRHIVHTQFLSEAGVYVDEVGEKFGAHAHAAINDAIREQEFGRKAPDCTYENGRTRESEVGPQWHQKTKGVIAYIDAQAAEKSGDFRAIDALPRRGPIVAQTDDRILWTLTLTAGIPRNRVVPQNPDFRDSETVLACMTASSDR